MSVEQPTETASRQEIAPRLPGRIPSLDGLRAISIWFVMLAHLSGSADFPRSVYLEHLGNLGVRVFFVISGFLITALLLKEVEKTGTVSLRGFYLRRTMRIFPAFYVFVGVVGLLAWWGAARLLEGDLIHAITYTMNFHHPHGRPLAHIWSLSVEEQFYLLWPATVWLAGPVRSMYWAAGMLVLAPLCRFGMWHLTPSLHEGIGQHFQTVADSLAVGCLLAGLFNRMGTVVWYQRALRSVWFLAIPLLGLALNTLQHRPRVFGLVGASVLNCLIALVVERWVRYPGSFGGAFLNWAPMRFTGVLSYSLYLWQQLFLDRTDQSSVYTAFPLNIVLVFVFALLSYYLIERPFLAWKDRLGKRTGAV
jgi:peptidoglycan/LPS O-acetylase OafA/YrhL